jgi:exonuclease VII large subunit
VIAAIGHDKDVPLVSLAADIGVSTPSIATVALNESWNKAELYLDKFTRNIIGEFETILGNSKFLVSNTINTIKIGLKSLLQTIKQKLDSVEDIVYANNPERQLEVGYSIARINGKVVKGIEAVSLGNSMETSLFDGIITSEIKKIK